MGGANEAVHAQRQKGGFECKCALWRRVPVVLDAVGVEAVRELVVVRQHVGEALAAVRVQAVKRLVEHELARVVVVGARRGPRPRWRGVRLALGLLELLVVHDVVVADLRARTNACPSRVCVCVCVCVCVMA